MRCDFFTISAIEGDASDLNRLLASSRVLSVDRQFVSDGAQSYWSVCVLSHGNELRKSGSGTKGIDYREVLSPEDFAVYVRLRESRKALAAADGVPPYSVFTNEQLAEIVTRRVVSIAALRDIPGIGDARIRKYGERILDVLKTAHHAGSS